MTGELVVLPDNLEWVNQYVGIPFEELNCWQLCKKVFEVEFGIEIPDYGSLDYSGCSCEAEVALRMEEASRKKPWISVPLEEVQCGDILRIRLRGSRPICHVGIVFQRGWVLHTERGALSAPERYDSWEWCKQVWAYRHEELIRRVALAV